MDPNYIEPLGDRVLVETIKDTKTEGGVIIPDIISEGRPERARVLAVGPGRRTDKGELVPMPVAVGDVVIFNRLAGTHIGGLDSSFIVFREQDLLAKYVEPDES